MRMKLTLNEPLTRGVYHMRLEGDTRAITRPGQFVQLALTGFYLRRPLSVCDWQPGEQGTLDIIYKVVGRGTEAMSAYQTGMTLDALLGLGNGYDLDAGGGAAASRFPLLAGGGVGVPPLYALAKRLIEKQKKPIVVMGFNTAEEVFWIREFRELGANVTVVTADGSLGEKGFATDAMSAMRGSFDYVYTCGPEPMLKAVYDLCEKSGVSGQFSFEQRMACGFGACMGCSCQTKYGAKRICRDGPVLFREEIVW